MRMVHVTGVEGTIAKLRKAYPFAGKGCEVGLKRAGLLVQRESMKEVPVDTGNLRGSSFCRNVGGAGFSADVGVGYTASYAVFVHENMDAAHGEAFNKKYAEEIARETMNNRGPKQKAKFLEDPVKRLRRHVLLIVASAIREYIKKI